jgi:hypothetical protein
MLLSYDAFQGKNIFINFMQGLEPIDFIGSGFDFSCSIIFLRIPVSVSVF